MRYILLLFLGWVSLLSALEFGDDAPGFFLYDQEGFAHSLNEHRGRYVLLFFYPRDFTHSGVREARTFEQFYQPLKEKDVIMYGVSNDFVATHRVFHERFKLTYDLLSDPDKEMIRRYHADSWLGTKTIAYLIGPDGRIFRKYENKRSSEVATLVLRNLQ